MEVDRGTVVVFPEPEVLVPPPLLPLPLLEEDVEPPDLPVLPPPPLLFPPPPPPLRRSKCLDFGRLALTNGMNIVESPAKYQLSCEESAKVVKKDSERAGERTQAGKPGLCSFYVDRIQSKRGQ